ncbi:long-chain fatty acid--CoA ligase [soil metagenome]
MNVADLVHEHAGNRPYDEAIVDVAAETSVTWGELDARVDALANGFAAAGFVAGQRVALALTNSRTFVVTYLAVARAGLVAVPMNPRSATGELVRVLADSGARLAVGDAVSVATLRSAVGGLQDALESADEEVRRRSPVPVLAVEGVLPLPGEHAFADLAAAPGRPVVSPADRENLAVLLYTSGTSGRPRGAMLSHRALLANIGQVAAIEPAPTRADDVVLGLLPLFHVFGLNAVLGQVLAHGARLVLVDRFDAEQTLRVVAEHGVTNIPLAPPVVAAWAGWPLATELLASVRIVLSGAAPLDPDLRALFVQSSGVPVEQGYGLTEAAPVVTSTLSSGARAAGREPVPAGVGGPVPGVEIQARDAAGAVLLDDPGQIWVRGANLFSGYWPDGEQAPGGDGWWPTGDVGLVDRDGDLVLVDRLRELVIVNGFNVYPTEVEEVIAELPEVAQVAVVGVPDELTGEAVVAFVVADDGAGDVSGASAADPLTDRVRAHCERRLARYKRPREVTVVEGLPHSATGKVAKGRLRAQARRSALGLT